MHRNNTLVNEIIRMKATRPKMSRNLKNIEKWSEIERNGGNLIKRNSRKLKKSWINRQKQATDRHRDE